MQPFSRSEYEQDNKDNRFKHLRLTRMIVLILLCLGLILFNVHLSSVEHAESRAPGVQLTRNIGEVDWINTPTATLTSIPAETQNPLVFNLSDEPETSPLDQGYVILSIMEAGHSRLFAYQPMRLPLTRLTIGPWDDITPAISPDGSRLAFSSNRDGYWDIYLMDLSSGTITRLTDTPNYDAGPSWSPDGHYLAFETYTEDLEIQILSVDNDQPPISLSGHPSADYAPSWSPGGRQIAFVSTRSGDPDIWLADLDKMDEERFINLSQTQDTEEWHPIWSPDGGKLAWASIEDGRHSIYIRDSEGKIEYFGSGDYPVWNPDGTVLLTVLSEPNSEWITAYFYSEGGVGTSGVHLALPPFLLPGSVDGLTWGDALFPEKLPEWIAEAAAETPVPLWEAVEDSPSEMTVMRAVLAELGDLSAPYPFLHDLVDESFDGLRHRVAGEAGWDFLASLENAFVPLTAPLAPGMGEDWLYTGRAFSFSPLPVNAGWVVITQERFGSDVYWRVYLRTRFQDGSQGRPLRRRIWDFNARYSGDPLVYEQGGRLQEDIPSGYWLDFTSLAQAYGWERLPALPIWQSAYFAARFNEFVLTHGKTWRQAMLELYPPEALQTPTVIPPPTLTPTPTPWWRRTP